MTISPRPALDWIEARADLLRTELQDAFTVIAGLPESPEKSGLQARFAKAAAEASGVLGGYHDLEPYITAPGRGEDIYAVPEFSALRELAGFEDAPEVALAMRRAGEDLAEWLSAELTDGDIPASGLVGHLMEGRSLSAGQLGDRLRGDAGAWLGAHGETPEAAPPDLLRDASAWLLGRIEQAQMWIDSHPEAIPAEAYGWMAHHHHPEAHEGRSLAEISDRYAARLASIPDEDLGRLARGEPEALATQIRIADCRRAFAADALQHNRERLIALGHAPEGIEAGVMALRARVAGSGSSDASGAGLDDAPHDPTERQRRAEALASRRSLDATDDDDYSL